MVYEYQMQDNQSKSKTLLNNVNKFMGSLLSELKEVEIHAPGQLPSRQQPFSQQNQYGPSSQYQQPTAPMPPNNYYNNNQHPQIPFNNGVNYQYPRNPYNNNGGICQHPQNPYNNGVNYQHPQIPHNNGVNYQHPQIPFNNQVHYQHSHPQNCYYPVPVVVHPPSPPSHIDCPKCKARGHIHDSNMRHDKPTDQKCFFCKTCPTCHGRKEIPNDFKRDCKACNGLGFQHESSMRHDKDAETKCFFCQPCRICNGTCRV